MLRLYQKDRLLRTLCPPQARENCVKYDKRRTRIEGTNKHHRTLVTLWIMQRTPTICL